MRARAVLRGSPKHMVARSPRIVYDCAGESHTGRAEGRAGDKSETAEENAMKKAMTVLGMLLPICILAGCTVGAPNNQQVGGALEQIGGMLFMIVPLILIFYFMIIRPQSKQRKAREQMMKNLKVGDRVKTIGQMYGRIAEIKDNTVTIETGRDKVKLVFDRSAISTVEGGNEDSNADLQ
jgi:preprotein translocase subunit YajC